ncbi:response regulator [Uliginosibacterium sp. sgz301328]|uniref:response regulator n=1 Tax=Uliginosibacterium sp. sgz301328 TaxID=3243764 RepID=UPI00359E42A8
MIKVVIADDHPVVLNGIASTLVQDAEIQLCGRAHDGKQLMALVGQHLPDVVVTDYKMPDMDGGDDGAALIAALREQHPRMGIIVLTVLESPLLIRLALKRGANVVLIKRDPGADLIAAVRAVVAGRSYTSEAVAALLQASADVRLTRPETQLSLRETEVVRLFASGLTVTQIAEALNRSKKTISFQKRAAMDKIGALSDQDLLEYARREGLD